MTEDVGKLLDDAAFYAGMAKRKVEYAKAAYLSEPDPPTALPDFPVYGQQWRPWANDLLGYGSSTIGGFGCLVTSAACIVSDAYGWHVTPGVVNAEMKKVGGFVRGTGLFYFRKLEAAFPGSVKLSHIVGCIDVPAPVVEMDAWVAEGNYCIVRVDFEPRKAGVTSHYIPLFSGSADTFYWAVDPWVGSLVTIPPAYSEEAEWDAARIIYKVIFYERV